MKENQINNWINKDYLTEDRIIKFSRQFKDAKPFSHIEINNFFRAKKLREIEIALKKEEFFLKESDLFKVKQTNDLVSSKQNVLIRFREFLISDEFISYMEKISGLTLGRKKIDLAGSIYEDACYLLCHDDMVTGRKIAFLIYLSTMKRNDGGALLFFDKKMNAKVRIIPKKNTFVFFEVSKISFHEVEEVIVKKKRLALGGWFHD